MSIVDVRVDLPDVCLGGSHRNGWGDGFRTLKGTEYKVVTVDVRMVPGLLPVWIDGDGGVDGVLVYTVDVILLDLTGRLTSMTVVVVLGVPSVFQQGGRQ